jgi:hypothetical protein
VRTDHSETVSQSVSQSVGDINHLPHSGQQRCEEERVAPRPHCTLPAGRSLSVWLSGEARIVAQPPYCMARERMCILLLITRSWFRRIESHISYDCAGKLESGSAMLPFHKRIMY